MLRGGTKEDEIGVISPYASQTRYIRNQMALPKRSRLKISTVDSFQGSQREYIIISAVRTNIQTLGFLKDYRRLNVSLTRARTALIIVGNEYALSNDEIWGNFISFCKKFNDSYFNGGLRVVNIGPLKNGTTIKIERPSHQLDNFILKMSHPTKQVTYEDDDHVPLYSAESGKNVRYVQSSIAKEDVKIMWPDVKEDMNYLQQWVDMKLDKLKKGKNVTLSYDSECVCLQFGEVFPETFDIFDWKMGSKIPHINGKDGIIVFFYNKGDDRENVETPCKILKPLLEHPKVTLLTFDFTLDIEFLLKKGINVNKSRIIDCQLLSSDVDQEELISTSNNRSLNAAIRLSKNKDPMAFIARKEVEEGLKDFPWNANKFLIKEKELPITAIVSTDFLSYSANDIFLTAVMAVEVMTKYKLKFVIEKTQEKVKQFNEYWNQYGRVSSFREAEYCRIFYTVIMQGTISESDRVDQLLSRWNEMTKFDEKIKLNLDPINEMLNVNQNTKETIKRKLTKVTDILKKQIKLVKKYALLANPKENKSTDSESGYVEEEYDDDLDSLF